MSEQKLGVMLVGHGTKDEQGTREFFSIAEGLADRLASIPVAPALLEFQKPSIHDAWQELCQQGANRIRVAPLLLFSAAHAKDDIPAVVRESQTSHPDISFDQCRPISRHQSLVELVQYRICECIAQHQLEKDQIVLLMVGRGSRDPCAQADMRLLSEVVKHRLGIKEVITVFYAMAQPSLDQVLASLAARSGPVTVVIHPHLLFHGRIFESIKRKAQDAQRPQCRFVMSQYLGPDSHIVEAVAGRILDQSPS